MEESIDLPPGFRFHPTDEEIITHYLSPKIVNQSFTTIAVGEVDLNKCEPWDLPSKAKMGEKEWYFFCQRDRKYPTGMRTNRATEAGYWKATGKDKEIFRGRGVLVGMKKTLVFYRGRAPRGEKTNWVMHEYRIEGKSSFSHLPRSSKDEWVVCRVFHKNTGLKKSPMANMITTSSMNSFGDHHLLDSPSMPPLMDSTPYNFGSKPSSSYLHDGEESFDFKGIPTSTPMSSSYFSSMLGLDDLSTNFSNTNPNQNSAYYPQLGQLPSQNQYNFVHSGTAGMGYVHHDQATKKQCKVEQFPNHSMVSEDTGLSTDRNTEISSVVCGSYDDLDQVPNSSVGGPSMLDLDNMWKC